VLISDKTETPISNNIGTQRQRVILIKFLALKRNFASDFRFYLKQMKINVNEVWKTANKVSEKYVYWSTHSTGI
jgi:hypothetical protein